MMDPDGEEPTDQRGVVSDGEIDHSKPGQQAPQHDEGGDTDQTYSDQEHLQGPHQQHFPSAVTYTGTQQQLPVFPPPWPPAAAAMNPPLPPQIAAGVAPGMPPPPPPPAPVSHDAVAMAHYYEARMRDHAAAYASAAAGAAWAAAQIAAQAAEFVASTTTPSNPNNPNSNMPSMLPIMQPQPMYYPDGSAALYPPSQGAEDPNLYYYNTNIFPQQQQYPMAYSDSQQLPEGDGDEADYYPSHRNNRRKRSQRRPPAGINVPQRQQSPGGGSAGNNNNNNNSSRDRRRLRDGGDSSNSSCCSGSLGTSVTSYNSDQAMGYYNSQFRSGGRGHCHRYKKKQRQPRDDTSLLGKTAVSALYEWCDKRRMKQPSFVLVSPEEEIQGRTDYETAVYLQDGEWGRGKGRTKASSKQDAAKKALLNLYPGVVFDTESGILVELPNTGGHGNHHRKQNPEPAASLEDLAPHLAKRLAIASGRDEEQEGASTIGGKADDISSKKLKRALAAYPGTTTSTGTSEDDDENAYYVYKGASVCSMLLHAMVQINERIPEAPQYTFEVANISTANTQMKRKGPASSYGNAIVIHRGSPFTCKASLKVYQKTEAASRTSDLTSWEASENEKAGNVSPAEGSKAEIDGNEKRKRIGQLKDGADLDEASHQKEAADGERSQHFVLLEAVGVGGTKREAKHTASAKLLALLFPECETMVEVKAAAEAAREEYAASRAMKQQTSRGLTDITRRRRSKRGEALKSPRLALSSWTSNLRTFGAHDNDPALPEHLIHILHSILGWKRPARKLSSVSCQVAGLEKLNLNQDPNDGTSNYEENAAFTFNLKASSDCTTKNSTHGHPDEAQLVQDSTCRQLSRQKQLEEQVDEALQALNEHDDEGRSLPDELTVDDVGRLVLRRATADDVSRIRKLLPNEIAMDSSSATVCKSQVSHLSPVSILEAGAAGSQSYDASSIEDAPKNDDSSIALRLWSSSTFVLLLCRAIAVLEDPPLGCAVLTLGFSMQKGRVIRIAQIGSKPHLPPERFLECLETFAVCMGCRLECKAHDPPKKKEQAGIRLNKEDLRYILESHLRSEDTSEGGNLVTSRGNNSKISSPLQSVLEESEGGEDSDRSSEAIAKDVKVQDKPCKRSRVQ